MSPDARMLASGESIDTAAPVLLDRIATARHIGFRPRALALWARRGLLPNSPRGWTRQELNEALEVLIARGYQPAPGIKPLPLPGVQKLRRKLVDDTYRRSFRHRETGAKLPGPYASPAMMAALIQIERQLVAREQDQSGEGPQPHTNKRPRQVTAPSIISDPGVPVAESAPPNHSPEITRPKSAPEFLTEDELAARWRLSPDTLKNWRSARSGVRYVKIGRQPLYRRRDIEEWERTRTVNCDAAVSDTDTKR